jgi:hypothetical protein
MDFIIKRKFRGDVYTIGDLFSVENGKETFICNVLEDRDRFHFGEQKIMHETAIPEGDYVMIVTYSERFKTELPILLSVPQFTGIRWHWGTDQNSTSGCQIMGDNKEKGKVFDTRKTMTNILSLLKNSGQKSWKVKVC